VNEAITRDIVGIHRLLGVDVSVLYPYFGGFRIFGWTTSEDLAGNPVHLLLGMAALAYIIMAFRRIPKREQLMAGSFLAGGLLLVLTVRWQPFIARLHIPVLLLLPVCLLVPLERRWPRATMAALFAAVLLALPALLLNSSRPILPAVTIGWKDIPARSILVESRTAQHFVSRPELYAPYRHIVETLAQLGCRRVELAAGYDSWEYPLWAMGRKHDLRFRHLRPVTGAAGTTHPPSGTPCAVVGLDQPAGWKPPHVSAGALPLFSTGTVTLWR
jgi:hypothetical protein